MPGCRRKKGQNEQIAFALRQAEAGTTVGYICRKMGVAEATFLSLWTAPQSLFEGVLFVLLEPNDQQTERAVAEIVRVVIGITVSNRQKGPILQRALAGARVWWHHFNPVQRAAP